MKFYDEFNLNPYAILSFIGKNDDKIGLLIEIEGINRLYLLNNDPDYTLIREFDEVNNIELKGARQSTLSLHTMVDIAHGQGVAIANFIYYSPENACNVVTAINCMGAFAEFENEAGAIVQVDFPKLLPLLG